MEKKEKPKERIQRVENRDLQLLKIQVYADKCHAMLSARISFAFVVFSFIVIFYPLYIQAALEWNPYSLSGLVGLIGTLVIASVAGIHLNKSIQKYNRNLRRISDMVESFRKGEDLPPLEKMDDWKANSNETEKK